MLAQARRTFGALDAPWPEDAFEALQLQGAQERLRLGDEPTFGDSRRRLLAVGTSVHPNDAEGLSRLCRYGARGPIAEARLSQRDDGRFAYETKKGVTSVLTAQQLVPLLSGLTVTSTALVQKAGFIERDDWPPGPSLPPATLGSRR